MAAVEGGLVVAGAGPGLGEGCVCMLAKRKGVN